MRITRAQLMTVIRQRVEELTAKIEEALKSLGFTGPVGRQVVLTGGGANSRISPTICRACSAAPSASAVRGRLTGLPDAHSGPAFSTLVGLACWHPRAAATSATWRWSRILNRALLVDELGDVDSRHTFAYRALHGTPGIHLPHHPAQRPRTRGTRPTAVPAHSRRDRHPPDRLDQHHQDPHPRDLPQTRGQLPTHRRARRPRTMPLVTDVCHVLTADPGVHAPLARPRCRSCVVAQCYQSWACCCLRSFGSSSRAPMRKHTAPTRVPRLARSALRSSPVAGIDVAGDSGDAEGDGPEQVDQRYPPRPRPRAPGDPAVADLEPGQCAGHQEADRADRVGPPHVLVGGLRGQVDLHGRAGADVEVERSDQLHRGRPPVDPPRLVDEEAPPRWVLRRGAGVDRLAVGQERGRGEEQRPDEERHGVPADSRPRRRTPGSAPSANSSDPTANRTAIHHPRACGAHHVEPWAELSVRCLRWRRDSQRTTTPSERTWSTKVAARKPCRRA